MDPFKWKDDGMGLHVNMKHDEQVQSETLFEESYTIIKERPLFLGHPFSDKKFLLWMGIFGCVVVGLLTRAFFMQIVRGNIYAKQAENNRLRHIIIPARRGIVLDTSGIVVADNSLSFDLIITPWLLPRTIQDRNERLATVSRLADVEFSRLVSACDAAKDPTQEILIKRNITYERAIALQIFLGNDDGIRIDVGSRRNYPLSSTVKSFSHILGYIGIISEDDLLTYVSENYRRIDQIGKTGLESSYESVLRGTPGQTVYEVDAHSHITHIVSETKAIEGEPVTLSISANLQQITETALRDQIKIAHAPGGAAIAMDPRDGSLLALVSWPSYDNNNFSGGVSSTVYSALLNDADHPLLPRAWAGIFPAGSTIKPLYAIAALAEKTITEHTTVNSVGGIHMGSVFFPDWKAGGHGITDVRKAIAWSVNTFFYSIGGGYGNIVGLGIDRLQKWLVRFGMGSKTGLDLPGEQAGFVPSSKWKEEVRGDHWYIGDTYNLSIGQGDLLVTPLQIARNTATIANGGTIVTPHIVYKIGDNHINFPESTSTVAEPEIIKIVREGMRGTVAYGSGRALSKFPVEVAGKTGTAQWNKNRSNHAWFTAFAPYNNPEIVVTVLIEEGVEGSRNAVPVARKMLDAWYAKRPIRP